MAKEGILHDYDLRANQEPSARKENTCAICGTINPDYQWGDYSGEAMCTRCGCPYQLKWGSKEQEAEGKYPYLNLKASFISIAKEYWEQTHSFVCYGIMLGDKPGMKELNGWIEKNHPELLKKKENPND